MSKRQWGYGYHAGQHEVLARLGLPGDVMRKIDDLKRRVEYHEDHFDSFDCDYAELQLRLGELNLRLLVYGGDGLLGTVGRLFGGTVSRQTEGIGNEIGLGAGVLT